MKTLGKIIICIIVILLAIGTAYLIHNNQTTETGSDHNISSTNTISNKQNIDNEKLENEEANEKNENTEYIGKEEQQEEIIENEETENNENKQEELTGKDKAIDIVTKKYATEGEIVKFDHMEGNSYIIKINAGTAVTWYLVDGTTWEAEEY